MGTTAARTAGLPAHALNDGVQTLILVEGPSDKVALGATATRLARDLNAEGIELRDLGGATSIGRALRDLPRPWPRLRGMCDADEEGFYWRALNNAGLLPQPSRATAERAGFFVCDTDLEDELIRALGPETTLEVIAAEDRLEKFRTYQHQPAQRERSLNQQLRGYVTNWKITFARLAIEALAPECIPRPLRLVLA